MFLGALRDYCRGVVWFGGLRGLDSDQHNQYAQRGALDSACLLLVDVCALFWGVGVGLAGDYADEERGTLP